MADWEDFRRSLEDQPVRQPPLSALRERRRRRQQRKAIAATFAVVMVGSAAGLAVLGQTGRRPGSAPLAAPPPALNQIVNSDRLPPPKDYEDYVVTDVDFVSERTGWAVGLRCVGDACDVASWRTDDGGETWGEPVPVATRVPRASYHEEDPRGGAVRSIRMVDETTGYAFNPDLYVTRDGGRTWQRSPQRSKVTSVSVQETTVWVTRRGCAAGVDCDLAVATGTVGGPLTELDVPGTDGAAAVVRRSGPREAFLVSWDAPDGSPAALYRTRDAGRTWTPRTMPCADPDAVSLSARPGTPTWLVCTTGETRTAHTSSDAGATWRAQPAPPADGVVTDLVGVDGRRALLTTQTPGRVLALDGESWRPAGVARAYGYGNLDVVDGALFAMGDAGDLWRGRDGSETWQRLALPPRAPRAQAPPAARGLRDASVAWTGMSFSDARNGWVVGERCSGGECRVVVRRTLDGGDTWVPLGSPPYVAAGPASADRENVWEVAFTDDLHGWLAGDRFYATADGGATWRALEGLPPRPARLAARGGVVWAIAYGRCDDNTCPVVLRFGGGDRYPGRPLPSLGESARLAAVDERRAYLVSDEDTLFTDDGGETWQRRTKAPCLAGSASAWSADGVWVVCAANLDDKQTQAVSTDGGRTWRRSPLPGTGADVGELVALSPTYAWRTGANRGVLVTRDGGRTWTGAPTVGDPARALTFTGPAHGWLLAGRAIYRTTDGEHWERLG